MRQADTDIVLLSGVRTGFGSFGGTLKDFTATDLGTIAAKGAIARSGLDAGAIDHVVIGNALQTSADAIYLARHVGLRAGVPLQTPAVTVNRLCGSGFEAVVQAAQLLRLGEAQVVLAGGTESMSQAPHVVRGARWGLKLGAPAPLEDLLWAALTDPECGCSMAETAERLAEQYGIARAAVDCYAAESQARAKAAWAAGAMSDELCPIPIRDRKTRQEVAWARDEHMRPDTTLEGLAALPPYFRKDGVVTAGNASGIADGAAALVATTRAYAKVNGLEPLATLRAWGWAGVEPGIMGIGPVPASQRALEKAGVTLDDLRLVEVNEAFGAQYLAVEQALGLDRSKTNVDGGAIALGHPLGASGARITAHLVHALRRAGGGLALGAACIGGGQGIAVVLEA